MRCAHGFVLTALALGSWLVAGAGCHKKCEELSACPGGDDYVADACGCRPVAGASTGTDAYPCGVGAMCDGQTQTCEHVVAADRFDCIALPAACVREPSCACLSAALHDRGASACSGEGRHLTVRIGVP